MHGMPLIRFEEKKLSKNYFDKFNVITISNCVH